MAETDWRSFDLHAPTDEHRLLAETLREFVEREVEPQAAEHDREERFNLPLFRRAGDLGLLGATLPEAYGGAGLDATAAVQIYEALSTSDPGFALAVLAHAILFAQNLAVNGDDAQRSRILPPVARGERVGGLCMTEPEVGTDVLAMRTRAKRDGDVYVLDGTKTFITNGGIDDVTLGDVFVVYAATGEGVLTSFLVEKGTEGFRLGQKWKDKLGCRASFTAELIFDGARVPAANRLGEEGQGTLQMMRNLEVERLTLAAMALGIAARSVRTMVGYANERRSFGVPLREHGQIQRYIAESFAEMRSARAFVYDTARRIDLAATGQRVWRDAKLLEIGGGTLEAHHKNLTKDLCRNPALVG
jgi:isovaleryl-CoA dehydrogenase